MTGEDRDAVVAAALAELPVPPHGSAFWSDLDRRLRAEASRRTGANDEQPARVAVLDISAATPQRAARRIAIIAAAAALVVGAVAVVLAARGRDDDVASVAGQVTVPTTASAPANSTTIAPDNPTPAEAAARDAAVAWLDELASGDTATAWAQLGPASRDSWGNSFDSFDAARASFADTFTSWATATNRRVRVASVAKWEAAPLYAVTFTGQRDLHGVHHDDALVLLVRDVEGRHELEPFTPSGTIGLRVDHPQAGPTPVSLGSQDSIEISVPTDARGIGVVVDDGDEVAPSHAAPVGGDQQFSYLPPGGWTPGRHTVSVVTTYADGTPAAVTLVFVTA
jgi:hypothetical protein